MRVPKFHTLKLQKRKTAQHRIQSEKRRRRYIGKSKRVIIRRTTTASIIIRIAYLQHVLAHRVLSLPPIGHRLSGVGRFTGCLLPGHVKSQLQQRCSTAASRIICAQRVPAMASALQSSFQAASLRTLVRKDSHTNTHTHTQTHTHTHTHTERERAHIQTNSLFSPGG